MTRRRNWNRGNSNNNSWSNFKKPRPPPGLRGKEIGLFYRDNRIKTKKELCITLNVPELVIQKLITNLSNISALAEKEGIDVCKNTTKFKPTKEITPSTSNDHGSGSKDKIKTESRTENESKNNDNAKIEHLASQIKIEPDIESKSGNNDDTVVHQIKIEPGLEDTSESHNDISVREPAVKQLKLEPGLHEDHHSSYKERQGSSSMPDFIPINSEWDGDYRSADDIALNLRGDSVYKYGYNDIITGTFSEKLDESLAKGITIAKLDSEIESLNITLYENYQNMTQKSQYKKMMEFRSKLPTYKKRKELKSIINDNQVVVISGETGCGKSTQVPQLILDDAILNKKGGNVRILVTQPRRIAASSLAARVASERAEAMGQSVGYVVRLEKVEPRARGSITFCTTGIMLVDLEVNQGLTEYSHVILDEVHERDVHIDLAMCMLKQVLQKRKDLKLILMSATLDSDKLCSFFNDCPIIHIEGLAYPVKDVYLEEILELTKFQLPEPQNQVTYPRYRGNKRQREISEKAIQYRAFIAPWLESIKKTLHSNVYNTLQDHRVEEINIDLIFELIKYISKGPPGAILVFMPGISEITKLLKKILHNGNQMRGQFDVIPLHSKLPSLEQNKIFQRPPEHIRKIIIATNIAETSITIDDIVYVVDSGRIKYSGLNVEEHMNTLKNEWVSKANLLQRRGRAGRCQPGVCYHMLTTYRASLLDDRLLPELQRSDLLEPVLTIKRLRLGKASEALKTVPDSPAQTTILRAVTHLQQCGALNPDETLTPLGWHLARLPVHPAAGKLLLLGALFGCLDRCASVAAVWSFKDPFLLILEKEDEVKAAKRTLALGEPSDHVAMSEALLEWERCPSNERSTFAYQYFLSPSTLELLSDMKKQLGGNLKQMGFLASGSVRSSWENRNADNLSLFKAIVAAALYPNITAANWTNLHKRNPNKQISVRPRLSEGKASIHPGSVMHTRNLGRGAYTRHAQRVPICSNPGANWLVYWLKQRSSEVFLIDVTMVYTLPLVFFGELKVSETDEDPEFYIVTIQSYKVRILKDIANLLFQLRELLDEVLAAKIMVSSNHALQHSQFEEHVLNAVIEVLTAEDERVQYLDGYDNGSESDVSENDTNTKT